MRGISISQLSEDASSSESGRQKMPPWQILSSICNRGSQHPETAMILLGLARLYERWERYEQAEALLRRAYPIVERHLGQTHSEAVQAKRTYHRLLDQGRKTTQMPSEEQPTPARPRSNIHPPLNGSSEDAEAVPETAVAARQEQFLLHTKPVPVRGITEQVAYIRQVKMREVTFTCTICGQTLTQWH